jgi:two-component system response regulator RegA
VGTVQRVVKSLLIVDDEAAALKAAQRDLRTRSEMRVFYASDQRLAYKIAATEEIDVAIVDLRLVERGTNGFAWGVSGLDVVRQLKNIRPALVTIIWSGWLSIEATDRARDLGVAFCREKPTTINQILAQLERGRDEVPAWGTKTLARVDWEYMQRVLADTGNNVSETARRLGVKRSVLQRKLKRPPPPEFATDPNPTKKDGAGDSHGRGDADGDVVGGGGGGGGEGGDGSGTRRH